MKIEIKNRFDDSVIFSHETENNSIKLTLDAALRSNISLRWADLSEANLSGANLRGANLREADLRWADLRGADLRWANLSGANLSEANLNEANLSGANLSEADLRLANLRWANLSGANLNYANLRRANLRGANLREANLNEAAGNGNEINSMFFDKWPIIFTASQMSIGCESNPISEWRNFTDSEINKMDVNALKWWKKWKKIIFEIIDSSESQIGK